MVKKTAFLSLCIALAVPALRAQVLDSDAQFGASLSQIQAEVSKSLERLTKKAPVPQAATAATTSSCADYAALEKRAYTLVVKTDEGAPLEVPFTYSSCSQAEENDMIPPYVTRVYKGSNGYLLFIITYLGDRGGYSPEQSELSLGLQTDGQEAYAGSLPNIATEKLMSATDIDLGRQSISDYRKKGAALSGETSIKAKAAAEVSSGINPAPRPIICPSGRPW